MYMLTMYIKSNIFKLIILMMIEFTWNEFYTSTNLSLAFPQIRFNSKHPPLHADPGGIKDPHKPEHSLQNVPDGIRGCPEGADLGERFGFDVTHGGFSCPHQGFHLGQLSVDGLLSGLQNFVFLRCLSLQFLHLVLLITGILQGEKIYS